MAEVAQQWAHQKIAPSHHWARDIVEAWENILKETIHRKHDVQLHLHPQWHNAEYLHGRWQVDLKSWMLSRLPPKTIKNLLSKGKLYLDSILQPIDTSYECIAFRAGDYCTDPSAFVVQSLLDAGIVCDSSVTKGLYRPHFFDYRTAYSNIMPWLVDPDDIQNQGNQRPTVIELPIYSHEAFDSELLRKLLSPSLYYLLFFGAHISSENRVWQSCRSRTEHKRYSFYRRPWATTYFGSLRWWLSKCLSSTAIQLDYDVLPPEIFCQLIGSILEDRQLEALECNEFLIPVMTIGHVKRMHNCDNISRILELLSKKFSTKIVYWTLRDAVNYWISRLAA